MFTYFRFIDSKIDLNFSENTNKEHETSQMRPNICIPFFQYRKP